MSIFLCYFRKKEKIYKHSREYFIAFQNTSTFVKKTSLRVVLSTLLGGLLLPQVWPVFPVVTPYFRVKPISSSVTHFSKCDCFSNFDRRLFSKCDQPPFFKRDPFLTSVTPLFPDVTHFRKYEPFLQVWPIFKRWRNRFMLAGMHSFG